MNRPFEIKCGKKRSTSQRSQLPLQPEHGIISIPEFLLLVAQVRLHDLIWAELKFIAPTSEGIKLPLPPRPRPSLHSILYSILPLLSVLPLTGQAAWPLKSARDVVGLPSSTS
jgi:hypothetical protein